MDIARSSNPTLSPFAGMHFRLTQFSRKITFKSNFQIYEFSEKMPQIHDFRSLRMKNCSMDFDRSLNHQIV